MSIMSRFQKSILAMVLTAAILVGANPTAAQDLIPVSDITGGASVFVFRSGSKAAPKRFSTKTRATLSKGQRIDSSKKVTKQYTALAKVTPRRTRTAVVNPNDPRIPKIKTMSPGDASKLFAGVGEYYMDQNDYNNAITFFRESLDLDATNKVAPSGLSEALALKGNEELAKDAFPVAKTFFDEALKYNSNNGPALFGLAEVYTEQGKENEAIGNYESALANDKDLTTIYVPLGILYYQKGEIAKADDMLTNAVAASPNDAQAQYFLGLVRLAQNQNQDALAAFQLAKTIDPKNADAFYQTGEAMIRLGKKAEAVEEYTQATVLRDRFFDAWFALGSVNYELGKYPESIAAYQKAVRLRNDNIETYINLVDAYRQIGSFN
ncbi:MAG: tetratricopeptide repeat protein, partial [Blastocatellia bacterium]